MPIELGRFKPKIFIAILIGWETYSIDWKSGKINLKKKIEQFNAKTPQSTIFHEWNAWVWD